jgi:hypothetical protein
MTDIAKKSPLPQGSYLYVGTHRLQGQTVVSTYRLCSLRRRTRTAAVTDYECTIIMEYGGC